MWSTKDKVVVKDFGKVCDDENLSIVTSPKFLFVTNIQGNMKQFNIESKEMVKDFGCIHKGFILAISVTPDGKNLFTSDDFGNFKQFRINDEWVEPVGNQNSVYEPLEP